MPSLYILSGPTAGESYELKDGTTLVGRGPDSDVQIVEASVSRKHARITLSGERLLIEDLESQNGTQLNGHPISPFFQVEIKEGDFLSPATHLLHKDRRITDREKLETIYEVSTLLMQSLDIDEIGEKILDSVFSCIKSIDNAALLLVDPDSGEFRQITARSKEHGKDLEMSYSRTIVKRVIKERKPISMLDTLDEKEINLSESIRVSGIRSIMCVPLISRAKVMGVIYVDSVDKPHGFRKEDLDLLTALSSPAAVAIENSLLHSKYLHGMS